MDLNVITQMIGSVGFPIVACIVMFIQNNKMQETLTSIAVTMQALTCQIENLEDKMRDFNDGK